MRGNGHISRRNSSTGIQWWRLRALVAAACATGLLALLLAPAGIAAPHARAAQAGPAATLLRVLASEYQQAFPSHEPMTAARVSGLAAAVATVAASAPTGPKARSAAAAAGELRHTLSATSFRLQVWPLPERVSALSAAVGSALGVGGDTRTLSPSAAEAEASALVQTATADTSAGRLARARSELAEAYAYFTTSTAASLDAVAPELVAVTERDLWRGFDPAHERDAGAARATLTDAVSRVSSDLREDAASLGEVSVSRATIVGDAAIILFREGLEAVLILAAITASFTGERRRLRRPVLIGAGLGLAATAVTYLLAQAIVDALGDGGLRLQAITGVLAIAVLLVVTNWFFHKVYWSEWIARFNRRRRSLERVERLGIISGQTLGFVILGLTSVYREGFETVLFLQNLQVSAGTGATLLGVAIGLAATLIVGTVTFALGRKLPYKRMLILTGVLIGLVLAVMTGTTVNNLQGLGWIPSNAAGFTVDPRLSQWLGFYATWEGIAAQVFALLVVYGSYAVARQIQSHRRRRAIAITAVASAADV